MERGGAGACAGAEEGGARCQSEAAAEGDGAEEAEVRSRLAERCFWLLAGLLARNRGPRLWTELLPPRAPPLDGATRRVARAPRSSPRSRGSRASRGAARRSRPRAVEVAPPCPEAGSGA